MIHFQQIWPHQIDNKCCVSAASEPDQSLWSELFPLPSFWPTLLKLQPCVCRQRRLLRSFSLLSRRPCRNQAGTRELGWKSTDQSSAWIAQRSAVSSADVESQTLQGVLGELVLDKPGLHHLENTTLDFQKLSDKEILRISGPLGADFTIKVRALGKGRRPG